MEGQIAQLRRFNRAFTRRIGALDERFMGRGRPMAESRMLYEIGPDGQELRRLRARLGLDSGYASRLIRSLEGAGLIELAPSPADARVRVARLTPKGRREFALLDAASDRAAETVLVPLTPGQRDRLATALTEAGRLLDASAIRFEIDPPSSRDAQWCMAQYFAELDRRFSGGFRHDRSIADDLAGMVPPRGWALVARIYDEPVGCGTLTAQDQGFGEIKRVWLADRLRGLGAGRRLMGALEDLARGAGLPLLRLDTNESLAEAQALYRTLGYHEIPRYNDNPYAHHWFEKRLG